MIDYALSFIILCAIIFLVMYLGKWWTESSAEYRIEKAMLMKRAEELMELNDMLADQLNWETPPTDEESDAARRQGLSDESD